MSSPIIGITSNTIFRTVSNNDSKYIVGNNQEYVTSIQKAGGTPLFLPITSDLNILKHFSLICDGLLLAGGDDINPLLYGEEPHAKLGETFSHTDCSHIALLELILPLKKPILGICRGMQLLNIVCGGNVYQDLSEYPREHLQHAQHAPRADVTHSVVSDEQSIIHALLGSNFAVNSFHHQAIHRLGKNIIATSWSKDRVIESIELTNYPFAIGVQWHPELMLQHSDEMLPLFRSFVTQCCSFSTDSE